MPACQGSYGGEASLCLLGCSCCQRFHPIRRPAHTCKHELPPEGRVSYVHTYGGLLPCLHTSHIEDTAGQEQWCAKQTTCTNSHHALAPLAYEHLEAY
jgi:hypothetical protein